MVRVLFLVTSEYVRRILSLIVSKFSSHITYQIISYDIAGRIKPNRLKSDDLRLWLLGPRELHDAITRFDPDVAFSDGMYGTHFEIRSLWVRRRRPLIIHVRGDPLSEQWARFLVTEFPMRLFMIQDNTYFWTALGLASRVAPVCKWLEGIVRRYMPGKEMQVLPPPVDLERYYPEDGLQFERPAVAIMQNHGVYPKVAGLLDFKKVVEKLPDIHFYVAEGEAAPQPFLPKVREHYSNLHNVHFVGGIHGPTSIRRMLTACDCYVLATKLDCCPVSVIEASLMQRPVIASRVGGVPEIVLENKTGWTIENHATEDWVRKIRLVVSDPKLNRRLGQNGREFARKRFGSDVIATQMERLILNQDM